MSIVFRGKAYNDNSCLQNCEWQNWEKDKKNVKYLSLHTDSIILFAKYDYFIFQVLCIGLFRSIISFNCASYVCAMWIKWIDVLNRNYNSTKTFHFPGFPLIGKHQKDILSWVHFNTWRSITILQLLRAYFSFISDFVLFWLLSQKILFAAWISCKTK